MAPGARSMAASLLTASALLVALAALWCDPVAAGIVKSTKPRQKPSKDKFAELNFFLHDLVLLPNASTSFFVVKPLDGLPADPVGSTLFGGVVVFDDKLTAGPSRSSLEIGRARGLYVYDSLDVANVATEFIVSTVFNEASGFPGSTIQFRGFDLLPDPLREISISGGTGDFRLARGWAEYSVFPLENAYSVSVNFTAFVYYGGLGATESTNHNGGFNFLGKLASASVWFPSNSK